MIDYLARCPELVEKLKKHELGELSSRELVIFYNEQCTYQQTSPW